MAGILVSRDHGRKAENIVRCFLSQFALAVPVDGLEDKFSTDFIAIPLESTNNPKVTRPLPERSFYVQVKSAKNGVCDVKYESEHQVRDLMEIDRPYYIAYVCGDGADTEILMYQTAERVMYKFMCRDGVSNLDFVLARPGWGNSPKEQTYDHTKSIDGWRVIYMGEPLLRISLGDINDSEEVSTAISALEIQLEIDLRNLSRARLGIKCYERNLNVWKGRSKEAPSIEGLRAVCEPGGAMLPLQEDTLDELLWILFIKQVNRGGSNSKMLRKALRMLCDCLTLPQTEGSLNSKE